MEKSWKSHGIILSDFCGNPELDYQPLVINVFVTCGLFESSYVDFNNNIGFFWRPIMTEQHIWMLYIIISIYKCHSILDWLRVNIAFMTFTIIDYLYKNV